MKIVINIPESTWESVKRYYQQMPTVYALCDYVANGTPLTEIFEDIKAEIESLKHEHTDVSGYRWWNNAIDNALGIIDHHISEE